MGFWQEKHATTIDGALFRGHDQYLEQPDWYKYADVVRHIQDRGFGDWLKWGEDGSFGCVTKEVDGMKVSRDLLDSILEIAFLQGAIPGFFEVSRSILDVGAGYGRLAHRMFQAYPNAFVYCTDDIPVSMGCARTYLRHRGIGAFRVLERELIRTICPLDLAVNVHSWSECTMPEIEGWIAQLAALSVPRIFIVPHNPSLGCWDPDKGGGNGATYKPVLQRHGYKLAQEWHGPECSMRAYLLWERD